MKVNVLAFAPLGLAAFLVTVSAGPTEPTVDTDAKDKFTPVTVSAAFLRVAGNYLTVKAALRDTISGKYSDVTVENIIDKITTVNRELGAKDKEDFLNGNNPVNNGMPSSELLTHWNSKVSESVKKVCDTLEAGFSENTIPGNLLEKALGWAYSQSLTKILIEDHSTIQDYLMRRFPGSESISKESFMEGISPKEEWTTTSPNKDDQLPQDEAGSTAERELEITPSNEDDQLLQGEADLLATSRDIPDD
ncbi:hypothetical protein IWQ61_010582, partial [Dispira simplex]